VHAVPEGPAPRRLRCGSRHGPSATRQNQTRIFDSRSATCKPCACEDPRPARPGNLQAAPRPPPPSLGQLLPRRLVRVAEVDRHLRGATDGLVAQDAGQCAVRFHRSRGYEKLRWGIWGARLEEARFFRYRFGNKIALRFKKFRSRTLKTSNNNTAQTALFQSQQLEYFDSKIQPMTHVVAGYLLDDLAIDIDRLAVTCTMDGQHYLGAYRTRW
jgi:hypothetical protein